MTETKNMDENRQKNAADLFEYEMTEVMLLLKDEIAKVSGKDVLAEMNFDRSKLHISEVNIPAAETEKVNVEIPREIVLPEMQVTKAGPVLVRAEIPKEIEIPEITVPPVEAQKISVQIPEIGTVPAVSVSANDPVRIQVELPPQTVISEVRMAPAEPVQPVKAVLPDIRNKMDYHAEPVNAEPIKVTLPKIAEIPEGRIDVPAPETVKVTIPDTAVTVDPAAVKNVKFEYKQEAVIPAVPVMKEYQGTEITMEQFRVDVPSVTPVTAWETVSIEVQKTDTHVPKLFGRLPERELSINVDRNVFRQIAIPEVRAIDVKMPAAEKKQIRPASVDIAEEAFKKSKTLFSIKDI